MTSDKWSGVDAYITKQLISEADDFFWILDRNREAGLPEIDVSAPLGKLLCLLIKATASKRILELGTLGGYSTVWMANALPSDGQIVTLESDSARRRCTT